MLNNRRVGASLTRLEYQVTEVILLSLWASDSTITGVMHQKCTRTSHFQTQKKLKNFLGRGLCHISISALFDLMTWNTCYMLRFVLGWSVPDITFAADYVMLWPWSLTLWSSTFLVCISSNVIKHCTKFERNRTIRGWVIDDLINSNGPIFRGSFWPFISQSWGERPTINLGRR